MQHGFSFTLIIYIYISQKNKYYSFLYIIESQIYLKVVIFTKRNVGEKIPVDCTGSNCESPGCNIYDSSRCWSIVPSRANYNYVSSNCMECPYGNPICEEGFNIGIRATDGSSDDMNTIIYGMIKRL